MDNEGELRTALEEIVGGPMTGRISDLGAHGKKKAREVLERLYGRGGEGMTAKEIAQILGQGPEIAPAPEVVVWIDEEYRNVSSVKREDVLVDEGDTETTACIVVRTE